MDQMLVRATSSFTGYGPQQPQFNNQNIMIPTLPSNLPLNSIPPSNFTVQPSNNVHMHSSSVGNLLSNNLRNSNKKQMEIDSEYHMVKGNQMAYQTTPIISQQNLTLMSQNPQIQNKSKEITKGVSEEMDKRGSRVKY